MTLSIQARITGQAFAPGERIPFTLSLHNGAPAALAMVPDPRGAGDSLRFTMQRPGGAILAFSTSAAARQRGVPELALSFGLPPGDTQDFEFDLAQLTGLPEAGAYRIDVEYAWSAGQVWRSAPMGFELKASAAAALMATASEASGSGQFALAWTDPGAASDRLLLLEFLPKGNPPEVRDACAVATLPKGAVPAIGMAPAGFPFPERWLAWLEPGRLTLQYWAATVDHRLPAWQLAVPGEDVALISPLLAQSAPDEGRPGCLVGIVHAAASRQPAIEMLAVDPDGVAVAAPSTTLPGELRAVWGLSPDPLSPLLVLVLDTGKQLELVVMRFDWAGRCHSLQTVVHLEGRFVAGAARVAHASALQVGLVLAQDQVWTRRSLAVDLSSLTATERSDELPRIDDVGPVQAGVDGQGRLHLLCSGHRELLYVAPGADSPRAIQAAAGEGTALAALLLRRDTPALLFHAGADMGPALVRL